MSGSLPYTESPLTFPDYISNALSASVSLIVFPSRVLAKILYPFLISRMRVTCRAPPSVLIFVTLTVLCAVPSNLAVRVS